MSAGAHTHKCAFQEHQTTILPVLTEETLQSMASSLSLEAEK